MKRTPFSNKIIGLAIMSIVLVIALAFGSQIVAGQAPLDLLVQIYANASKDTRPLLSIDGVEVSVGQFVGMRAVMIKQENMGIEQASQEALNHLIRQKVIQIIAREMGFTPEAQEVDERLNLLFEQADQIPEVKSILVTQAEALGMELTSEAYKALLRESLVHGLEVEKIHQQILDESEGNVDTAQQRLEDLIAERYTALAVHLEASNLPEDARNIHIPTIDEIKVKQPNSIITVNP